jgi:hypothetical protein
VSTYNNNLKKIIIFNLTVKSCLDWNFIGFFEAILTVGFLDIKNLVEFPVLIVFVISFIIFRFYVFFFVILNFYFCFLVKIKFLKTFINFIRKHTTLLLFFKKQTCKFKVEIHNSFRL